MKNKLKFTILKKILAGFGILAIVVLITNILTYNKFEQNLKANTRISKTNVPSIECLNDLLLMVSESEMLIRSWVFIDKDTSAVRKKDLIHIHNKKFPAIKNEIIESVNQWHKDEQNKYFAITTSIDSLFEKHVVIMDELSSFESYQNTELMFTIIPDVTDQGDIIKHSDRIINNIDSLLVTQEKNMTMYSDYMEESFKQFERFTVWMGGVLFVTMILIGFMLAQTLIGAIKKINKIIKQMGGGVLPDVKIRQRSDEIGEMAISIKHLITGLKETSEFALKIGESNFATQYEPLSKDDVLGNSLLRMRENLIKANKDAELRKVENHQRNWSSQGLAEFSDLIRNVSNNLEELSESVLFKLVNYLKASIGGLFIVNDDNKDDIYLELQSFYAFDRHKFVEKRIEIGETLVGQCYQEQETIYLTDVPEDFIKIVSGLGTDKPKCILIVPLKVNEEIFGIVELASFKNLEKYHIEFVERIGEIIASAISNVKINIRTKLLLEESHEKSKTLEKQEIKARQNIEEIEAAYQKSLLDIDKEKENVKILEQEAEKNLKKNNELQSQNKKNIYIEKLKYNNLQIAINNSFSFYELNINGEFAFANTKYLKLISFGKNELIGMKHTQLISRDFINSGNYKKIWDALKKGKLVPVSVHYMIDGKNRIFKEKYTPVYDTNNLLDKIIVFCNI